MGSAGGMGAGVGGFFGAMGNLKAGQAADQAGAHNAASAEQNAIWSREKAKRDEATLRVSTKKQIGEMRANYAASGVQIDGSALDILEESAVAAEQDALNIRFQGEQQAYSYMRDAWLERMRGKKAREQSYYSAAGSFLGGATSAASSAGGSYGGGDSKYSSGTSAGASYRYSGR